MADLPTRRQGGRQRRVGVHRRRLRPAVVLAAVTAVCLLAGGALAAPGLFDLAGWGRPATDGVNAAAGTDSATSRGPSADAQDDAAPGSADQSAGAVPGVTVPGARGLDADASRSGVRPGSDDSSGGGSAPAGWTLTASEDFTGALDSGRWNVYNSKSTNKISAWSPSMVSTSGGRLVINSAGRDASGRSNTSGGLCWCGSGGNQVYGRWEVRAQFDRGTGYGQAVILWPASDSWPDDGEIDIVETPKGDRGTAYTTVHWGTSSDHQLDNSITRGDYSGWHTYAVEWLPGVIKVFIDGSVVYDSTKSSHRPVVPDGPMHLALQQEPGPFGDDWVAAPDSSTPAGVAMRVDWVRIYRRS